MQLVIVSTLVWFARAGFRAPRANVPCENIPSSVAVIGAGISGLSAAYELEKLGYDVTVFEAEDRVGGKIKSVYLEDGYPNTDFLDITEEEATKLCGNELRSEFGAVVAYIGGAVTKLADELGVPYRRVTFEEKVVVSVNNQTLQVTTQEYLGMVATKIYPGLNDAELLLAIGAEQRNWVKVFDEYGAQILSPGLDGQATGDLALPLSEFADKHGIQALVETTRPFVTGIGYVYYETVASAKMLKFVGPYISRSASAGIGFPCGFQSVPEAITERLNDVRLNSKVEDIQRKQSSLEIRISGDPMIKSFKHLVISTTLDLIPSFLDVSDDENDLFSRMTSLRYITTYTDIPNIQGERMTSYFADQGVVENINGISILGQSQSPGETPEVIYQIVDHGITTDDAYARLEGDLDKYFGLNASGVIAQADWLNYFPTVSVEDFAAGFYDRMEALQGKDNTYYVGGQFSFETTDFSSLYATDLVKRKFLQLELCEDLHGGDVPTDAPDGVDTAVAPPHEMTSAAKSFGYVYSARAVGAMLCVSVLALMIGM